MYFKRVYFSSGASWLSDVVDGTFETIGNIGREVTTAINNVVRELGNVLSSEEFRVALIIVAAFYTGGLAGTAAGGGMWGALAGAAVGGLTGAFTGAFHAQLSGDDPQVWLEKGFMIGAAVGGVSGYTKGFGMFENAADPRLAANGLQNDLGSSSECYSSFSNYILTKDVLVGAGELFSLVPGAGVSSKLGKWILKGLKFGSSSANATGFAERVHNSSVKGSCGFGLV